MMPGDEYIPRLSRVLDRLIASVGEAAAWLNVALIAVIITQVILRYVFSSGLVKLEELQWHLYVHSYHDWAYPIALPAILTFAWIYYNIVFSKRTKEIVDLIGTVVLLLPMVTIILMHSWPFVAESFRLMEASDSVVGLPYRWVVKSFLLLVSGCSA